MEEGAEETKPKPVRRRKPRAPKNDGAKKEIASELFDEMLDDIVSGVSRRKIKIRNMKSNGGGGNSAAPAPAPAPKRRKPKPQPKPADSPPKARPGLKKGTKSTVRRTQPQSSKAPTQRNANIRTRVLLCRRS